MPEAVRLIESPNASTTTTTHPVEFFSNKEITDEDLNMLMLYLENRRVAGGGDSSSHTLDASRRRLTVVYVDPEAKRRILERQVI